MHYRLRERAIRILIVGSALLLVYAGCSTPEPPLGERVDFSGTQRQPGGTLGFVAPEGWVEEKPSSSMRVAQYRLPGSESLGGDAELAVFSAIGGTVDQNVQRWLGQFESVEAPGRGRPRGDVIGEQIDSDGEVARCDRRVGIDIAPVLQIGGALEKEVGAQVGRGCRGRREGDAAFVHFQMPGGERG